MFTVYRKPYGSARLPMGHYKGEKAAREYAAGVKAAFPGEEVSMVEEADREGQLFPDVKPAPGMGAGAVTEPEILTERLPKKEGK